MTWFKVRKALHTVTCDAVQLTGPLVVPGLGTIPEGWCFAVVDGVIDGGYPSFDVMLASGWRRVAEV